MTSTHFHPLHIPLSTPTTCCFQGHLVNVHTPEPKSHAVPNSYEASVTAERTWTPPPQPSRVSKLNQTCSLIFPKWPAVFPAVTEGRALCWQLTITNLTLAHAHVQGWPSVTVETVTVKPQSARWLHKTFTQLMSPHTRLKTNQQTAELFCRSERRCELRQLNLSVFFFSFFFISLTSRWRFADQLCDVPLQSDHSALQRAGPVADGHKISLQLLQDAHRVPGQIRELSEHRAQGEAAHVRQVPENLPLLLLLLVLQPLAASWLAHIFRKYRAFTKRHDFSLPPPLIPKISNSSDSQVISPRTFSLRVAHSHTPRILREVKVRCWLSGSERVARRAPSLFLTASEFFFLFFSVERRESAAARTIVKIGRVWQTRFPVKASKLKPEFTAFLIGESHI